MSHRQTGSALLPLHYWKMRKHTEQNFENTFRGTEFILRKMKFLNQNALGIYIYNLTDMLWEKDILKLKNDSIEWKTITNNLIY